MLPRARPSARNAAPWILRSSVLSGALLACVALGACGEDEPDAPGPDNTARRGRAPIAVTPEQVQQVARERDRIAEARRIQSQRPPDPYATIGVTGKEAEEEAAAAKEAAKPRDYTAELLSAMRGTESCVKPRLASEGLPSELPISLEGLVLESGTVATGSARASVLTPEELQCVKGRLESTRLPPDVKDAPRRVSATLTLKFKKEGAAQPGAAAAAPTPAAPKPY